MEATPSPFERLLHLEKQIEQLQAQIASPSAPPHPPGESPARRIWPVDELLLTRLVRRSPEALVAYQAPAELTRTAQRDLRLTVADTDSVFQLCELTGGDAVVWVQADPPSWVWQSEIFQLIFPQIEGPEGSQDLVLQRLPVFKPVERGQRWTFCSPGQMIPRHRPVPEKEKQSMLLRRLENLERRMNQQLTRHESELNELRSQLRVQQDLLARLLRISAPPP